MSLFRNDGRSYDEIRSAFRWRVPEHYNIGYDACDKHIGDAGRVALHLEDAAGERGTVTFGQLKERSDRFANALRALGVERGDRVAIVLPQQAETVIAHIAIYKLGAVALPLAVMFGPDAIAFRLTDSGARLAITDPEHAAMLEEMRDRVDTLETVIVCGGGDPTHEFGALLGAASASFERVATRAEDPALLIYTSGTTGPPKGALVAHRGMLGNLTGFELSHNFFPAEGDLMYTPADWAWTGGLLDGLLPALVYGVPVLGFRGARFDAERAFRLMHDYGVRNAFIPPTAMKMLRQVPDGPRRYPLRLRSIMSAGEQVGAEVLAWAGEALGVKLNEMWGQTEFNYIVGNCQAIMPAKAGSMGRPYPGHDVDVIDADGNPVATGETGELAARRTGDPVFFLGYWNNEAATREKCVGEWFRTGDTGYRDEDGYLWFLGRNDDVISTAGHRVGPGEIEDCLLKHPAVAQAAVIGAPDDLRGEIIKAFIVLAEGHAPGETLAEEIRNAVRTRLARHEYPREIEFIEELPMTTTGKIRRVDLRRRERERRGDRGS